MHALIIEDEALIAMTIEEVLRDCGFASLDTAISTEEAIACARRACPDLITADANLKPGSGMEAVNSICTSPSIPVIFVTARAEEFANGIPLYPWIMKPFSADTLIKVVERVLASPDQAPGTKVSVNHVAQVDQRSLTSLQARSAL